MPQPHLHPDGQGLSHKKRPPQRRDPNDGRKRVCYLPRKARGRNDGKTDGALKMEWEEALLGSWGGAIPVHPAAYYQRKAVRARQVAEEATTRAVKARLLDEAAHCDHLAAAADRLTSEDRDFYRRYVEN